MRIETHKCYDPQGRQKAKPQDIFLQVLRKVNNTLRCLGTIRSELVGPYLAAFQKRLDDEAGNFEPVPGAHLPADLTATFLSLQAHPELIAAILRVIRKHLRLPGNYAGDDEECDLLEIDVMRATFLVPYLRVKAFTDVLGRESGIELWKEIGIRLTDEALHDQGEIYPPIVELVERTIRADANSQGFDFTTVVFDEHRFLMKFDRCVVHEALKYLDDPEIVYLSYCWTGDIEDARANRKRRRRRSQTLHLADFCDEFFWDDDVYPNAEQPSLEFMRGLGK